MIKQPFHNETSEAERREVHRIQFDRDAVTPR